jgi:hypothetical protein
MKERLETGGWRLEGLRPAYSLQPTGSGLRPTEGRTDD